MIIVTGGEGFIGSNLYAELVRRGYGDQNIISIDTKFEPLDKINEFLMKHSASIKFIFHMGAITDTMEMDINKFDEYNVLSSMFIWNLCTEYNIPLIYASSAATYGGGEMGYDDRKDIIKLQPLNPYGWSKQQFDVWTDIQEKTPPRWYGLKFFNVYGYGEQHKGKMASVVLQTYYQIKETGKMNLFRSHHPKFKDGEQMRDFVYIDDVVDVMIWLFENPNQIPSGLYNIGTGNARTFKDLATAVFRSLHKEPVIEYIDTPLKLRDKYQYFTQAKIIKLRNTGYSKPFTELEDGIKKYVEKLRTKKF